MLSQPIQRTRSTARCIAVRHQLSGTTFGSALAAEPVAVATGPSHKQAQRSRASAQVPKVFPYLFAPAVPWLLECWTPGKRHLTERYLCVPARPQLTGHALQESEQG